MAVVHILNRQEDFTGEFYTENAKDGLWRFNEAAPDASTCVADSSGKDRKAYINKWNGTTAGLRTGIHGRYFRFNITNPATEQTYLKVTNDGSIFANIGERIICGGWMMPTTYAVGTTFVPIFSTRNGSGNPIFYLSLRSGKPRMMLYNSAGSLILDTNAPSTITFSAGNWYFFAAVIEVAAKRAYYVIGDRTNMTAWVSDALTFTGELNRSCTADLVWGMLTTSYWYAGSFDDWFLDCDSNMTTDDLVEYFLASAAANGGDYSADVDALTEPGAVTLRAEEGTYASSGQLVTVAKPCGIEGTGYVSVTSEYSAGETGVSLIETSTSDDLINWDAWTEIGEGGELLSEVKAYIRYRVTLITSNTSKTPKLTAIQLYEVPKPDPPTPPEPTPTGTKLGYASPVVLDSDGLWEAVLENAYDVVVTSEVNGSDCLEFKLPFKDGKRAYLDNEKQVQIVDDIYRIRTITDKKDESGTPFTTVYAEAAFYDLAFSKKKDTVNFNADTADVPMVYALEGTDWTLGDVTVRTKRTWECSEKNALSILRMVQNIHGGDLIFDNAEKKVHLLTFGGEDSGALFCYRKNLKTIQKVVDTRSLVTRLYAYGKDGMTFASINDGKEYVESYAYTDEVRVSTLDCSNFTNPYQMLEFTEMRLAQYAAPRISYVLSAMDLSVLTGYEHETWDLGDIVTVDDRELGISIKTRIMRRQYNLQEPWNAVLELSTTLRELGDSSAQWDKAADVLSNTDVIDRQEMRDVVPFNHLRNSRADSGFLYWQNSGFELDSKNGVSGTASFKCEGVAGMTKSLMQTVYPANRDSYTFSAQIASEDLERGESGQVGIEVTFEYEDGSTEVRFIDLL